jgi:hypothetical protein
MVTSIPNIDEAVPDHTLLSLIGPGSSWLGASFVINSASSGKSLIFCPMLDRVSVKIRIYQ